MNLIVDGKKAVIKSGSSFEYTSENRAFTDSDAYTLAITLPMAGCPQNKNIFGYMDRMDFNSRNVVLDACIIDRDFCKSGVISVVEADESEIKVQFLEGRSVQNFLTDYDEIFINDLDLGSYPNGIPLPYNSFPNYDDGVDYLPFQWVNDSAEGTLNNEVVGIGPSVWADSVQEIGKLSYMPYLLFVAKKICEAVGFSYDFTAWENSEDRFLLICNAIPAVWNAQSISRALPHWSFSEFFDQLEKFLVCEFEFDYKSKSVKMTYSKDVDSIKNVVRLDEVVDDFGSEVSYKDPICKYRLASRIHFADRGDDQWKFDCCDWFVELMKEDPAHFHSFETTQQYDEWYNENSSHFGLTIADGERGSNRGKLYHIKETNTYFLWYVIRREIYQYGHSNYEYLYAQKYINRFCDYSCVPDPDESVELKIVPARVDYTSRQSGYAVFLAPAAFDETEDVDEDGITQPYGYSILKKNSGEKKSPEYYDKLFVAIWKETNNPTAPPCPSVGYRLSLAYRYASYQNGIMIKPKEKIKINFLSDRIPDVRSIFHIRGHRYLCERITATFSDDGMSRLMKGDFYPVAD